MVFGADCNMALGMCYGIVDEIAERLGIIGRVCPDRRSLTNPVVEVHTARMGNRRNNTGQLRREQASVQL